MSAVTRRTLLAGLLGLPFATAGCSTRPEQARPSGALRTALLTKNPFTIAHRGGSRDWPEMSMLAYRHSVELGVDALEMSLARTIDGQWFGLHDATLDRVAGVHGAIADRMTWAQVERLSISAAGTRHSETAQQPFLRFSDLADAYGATHTLFVDPKVVAAEYWPELFALMRAHTAHPAESFVAKGFGTSTRWATAARSQGFTTWGYYYGAGLTAAPSVLSRTAGSWDLLGLDVAADDASWAAVRAIGRPIIGHLVDSRSAASSVREHGAQGLMVSDPEAVLSL
ncbi:MAG: glycerophosphodiester phosphodiesterase family protein [Nakamurella sp.]